MLQEVKKIDEIKANTLEHGGPSYLALLDRFHFVLDPQTYFEIGSFSGKSLKSAKNTAVAVDPNFRLEHDNVANRKKTLMYNMTSDRFFREEAGSVFDKNSIDMAFLDGMHLFEFLLRDFMNTEKHCRNGSVIFLHDCFPLNSEMALRDPPEPRKDTRFGSMWTGDVWKLLPVLAKYRPELMIRCFDAPPTGLVTVTNLQPNNTVLDDNYKEIIEEFSYMTKDDAEVEQHWKDWKVSSGQELISGNNLFREYQL